MQWFYTDNTRILNRQYNDLKRQYSDLKQTNYNDFKQTIHWFLKDNIMIWNRQDRDFKQTIQLFEYIDLNKQCSATGPAKILKSFYDIIMILNGQYNSSFYLNSEPQRCPEHFL